MEREFKLKLGGRSYNIEIKDLSKSPVAVKVNGETFLVELEKTDVPGNISIKREASQEGPLPNVKVEAIDNLVTAPMPGKVLEIKVKVGDRVKYGDELAVLEAMKMEQHVRSVKAGVVKAVRARAGQMVAYGHPLIELEEG
ncbi:MAG: DUF2118 domain-containing protein [Chloroflexi bacterium]|nr:DUF2118 domain-containing protein [Chloroflexota bacterium]